MPSEDRVKLLLAPTLGPLRAVFERLRALPWAPLQRITRQRLTQLAKRIPQLAELLSAKPTAQRARPTPVDAPPLVQASPSATELPALIAALGTGDYQARAKAAQALAMHTQPEATEALIAALRDRSVEVSVAAANALAMAGGERATAALGAVLENADGYYHPLARAAAVQGLGTLLPPDQRAPIERALRDVDAEVSIAAIAALSATGSAPSTDALVRVVQNADGYFLPITRLAAARGLERLPSIDVGALGVIRAGEGDPLVLEVLDRLLERARTTSTVEA